MELLLGIWREACRHIEIDQAIERMAQHLAEHLPADFVLVRRLDAARAVLETGAIGWCRPTRRGPRPFPPRTECTSRQLTDVLRWIRTGAVRRGVIGSADHSLQCSCRGACRRGRSLSGRSWVTRGRSACWWLWHRRRASPRRTRRSCKDSSNRLESPSPMTPGYTRWPGCAKRSRRTSERCSRGSTPGHGRHDRRRRDRAARGHGARRAGGARPTRRC